MTKFEDGVETFRRVAVDFVRQLDDKADENPEAAATSRYLARQARNIADQLEKLEVLTLGETDDRQD